MLANFIRVLTKSIEIVVGLFLILMIVDVLIGVFFRYFLGQSLAWSDELATYLMIWMGFLAAAIVLKEGGHINVQMFRELLPPFVQKILIILSDILVIIFLGIWLWYSLQALEIIKDDISSGLDIRLLWPFLALPVCSTLMIVYQALLIIQRVRTWID